MLKVNQLVSGYGTVQILNGANMKVDKQSVVALLGGNGTGKSTILKAASGLIRSWKGTIEFNNEQIQNLPPHEIVAKGLVQVTQGKDVFPAMSVTENLRLGGFILKTNQQLKDNLEKVFNWNREYFIDNGQVKVNIVHYSSHSWDTVDLVRKASSRDIFAEKVFQHLYKR